MLRRTAQCCSQRRWLATETALPKKYRKHAKPALSTAIILTRAPFLTRTPTKFEEAYYAYQERIRRALSNPFSYDFYFKQGTLIETRFNVEERAREVHAFGDEYVKDKESKGILSSAVSEEQIAAAETLRSQEGEGEALLSRTTEADKLNDIKSLDRKGENNLFLLLRTKDDEWRFPQGNVEKQELLHQAAQRELEAECGEHMDTWVVSRNPIGVYRPPLPIPGPKDKFLPQEQVTFFYKAHIMAGQARLERDYLSDFAWLTKDEIATKVSRHYWDGVKDILPDV